MKITNVETIALRDNADGNVTSWNPTYGDSLDSSPASTGGYDITIVKVNTDEGISGIGQCEAPSLIIDAIIKSSLGLENLVINEDPTQVNRLWQKMYNSTGVFGRRGIVIAAIGAIETALWDITGKFYNKPLYELLWKSFTTSASFFEPKKM